MMTQITNWQPTAEAFSKAADLGRSNLDALVQSNQAYLAGMQDLAGLYAAAVQGFAQQASENAKALAAVKAPQDILTVQAELTRATVERSLNEGAKLQQAVQKLVQEVYAPLTRQVTAAVTQTKFASAA